MNKLRIWLVYYIMPKDVRKYLIKALSYYIEELEREVTELLNEMSADFYKQEEARRNKK